MTKLLLCRTCGQQPTRTYLVQALGSALRPAGWRIYCQRCDSSVYSRTKEGAIEQWEELQRSPSAAEIEAMAAYYAREEQVQDAMVRQAQRLTDYILSGGRVKP